MKASTKGSRRLQRAAKAASKALATAATREHNRPAKDALAATLNIQRTLTGNHYLARDLKGGYAISEQAADAINEVIAKGNLTDRDQITMWRVHAATKVGKDGQIKSPAGYAPQLCGFVWGGTHYGTRLQYKAKHKEAKPKVEKPIVAGEWRSVTCPKCNAPVGHICVRDNGKPQHNIHAARKQLAASGNGKAVATKAASKSATSKSKASDRTRTRKAVTAAIGKPAMTKLSKAVEAMQRVRQAAKAVSRKPRKVRRKR